MATPDFGKLQTEVSLNLAKAQRGRRIMQCVQIPTYIVAFSWVLLVPFAGYLLGNMEGASEKMQHSLPLLAVVFGVFMAAAFAMSWAYHYFSKKEDAVISRLIEILFPTAKYHKTPRGVTRGLLKSSRLFGIDPAADLQVQVFGSLEIAAADRKLTVADIAIAKAAEEDSLGGYLTLLRMIVRMIFGGRADNAMMQFRGMFTWVDLEKTLPGSVIVLPDHIEGRLGYMAKTVQQLRNSRAEKLVTMEDPAFEEHYAVYASDEVLARYVLTPAMMLRLTQLRERFGRDVMVSFIRNRFCCAVSSPDGFFALRSKAIRNGCFVEEIYDDITTAVDLTRELRLDKIVKNENKLP